jgi:type II secretory pathway component GspD/PulD (secretin)
MRPEVSILPLVGLLAWSVAGFCQTNPVAPLAALAPPTAVTPEAVAVTNNPSASGSIALEEADLVDAIDNLARVAGIQYTLDPRIPYGRPGPDGKVVPWPLVTKRWENITAAAALNELLRAYNLQLIEDPQTKTARIAPSDSFGLEPILTRTFQLRHVNPTNLLASAQLLISDPRSKVAADAAPGQLTVVGTEKELAAIDGLVRQSDTLAQIVYDDQPLTDVIRNLARLAGLNIIFGIKYPYQPAASGPGPASPAALPGGPGQPEPRVTVHWENLTYAEALSSLLDNYDLQMVEDPKTGTFRIAPKEPGKEPLVTRVFTLNYASPTNIVTTVRSVFTETNRSKVMPDTRTSQLVVVATEKEMAIVSQMITNLDMATKQVLIEARLLETVVNPSTSKGVDWSGTLKNQNVSFGNGAASGTTTTTIPGTPTTTTTTLPSGRTITGTSSAGSSSLSTLTSILGAGGFAWNTASGFAPPIGFLNADGVHAVLSFLNQYSETKIISSPRTVTLDNETATIEAGTQYPIVNVTAGTPNTPGGSTVTYSNLTVRLEVTPHISLNNTVRLAVNPRVLRLGESFQTSIAGQNNTINGFNSREMKTTVMIPSGNTLVMGGLIEDSVQVNNTKVPLLGDIPYVGQLFRSDSKSRTKSNLLIFLTPTIVQEQDFQPTKSDFLQTPVPTKDVVEADWSSWDSGKKKEWKKPKPEPITRATGPNAAETSFDENVWGTKNSATNVPTANP